MREVDHKTGIVRPKKAKRATIQEARVMGLFWFSAILVIASNVAYHVCQKSIPGNANPIVSIIVTYAVALAASLCIYPLFPSEGGILVGLRNLNWASVALAFTILGIEAGYLLVYRSGWNISLGPVFCNVMVALALVPIGLLLYKEKLILSNYVGIAFALMGIYLIARH